MDNEPAVISQFKKALRKAAQAKGSHFDEFPLGPQDRATLADDIWATYDNFAVVESKASQRKLSSEAADKFDRVQALCEGLQSYPEMASLHARCHRIAWRDDITGRLVSQEYRSVVCGKDFSSTCVGVAFEPDMTVDEFAQKFFNRPPENCLQKDDFVQYVRWLTEIVTGEENEIVVLASSDEGGFTVSSWMSLQELSALLPKGPSNTQYPGMGMKP